jgi:hypothetical protein
MVKVRLTHYKSVIEQASTIKSDFQRDCKSWYKFDKLIKDLRELKNEYEALAKELARCHLINFRYQARCECKIDFGDLVE